MEIKRFDDFNKAFRMLVEEKNCEGLRVIYYPSELKNCCCVYLTNEKYSLGLWASVTGLTIHEYGLNLIKPHVYDSTKVTAIETTSEGFRIKFAEGYTYNNKPLKTVEINLLNIKNSIIE